MTTTEPPTVSSHQLAARLGARHLGPERQVAQLASPDAPRPGSIVVIPTVTSAEVSAVAAAGAVAVVCGESDDATLTERSAAAAALGLALLVTRDTRLALALLTHDFDRRPALAGPGVHPSAVVAPSARLGHDVRIGPGAVIGADVSLGDGVVIGALASVGAGCVVGAASQLHERVVLADGVRLGARCRLHAGAVIGADGFGYALGPRGAVKIHHLGGVEIGDDVEIGANTCIDRGTLGDTRIGHRCKVDNLVQIGHNVSIGNDVVIAGHGAIAGSVRIEDRAVLGGAVVIADHVVIGAGARLAGRAGVTKDVPPGAAWGGTPAQPMRGWVRERYLLGRLETLWREHLRRRSSPVEDEEDPEAP